MEDINKFFIWIYEASVWFREDTRIERKPKEVDK
jgi:hypothetical protein